MACRGWRSGRDTEDPAELLALDLLHEISQQRQIVFFSQEEEVLAWAKRELEGSEDSLIELGEPAAI